MIKVLKKIKHYVFFSSLSLKRIIRKFKGEPIIHVIGDSHSLLFQHDLFIIHHIGPATAFKLSSNISTTDSKKKSWHILQSLSKNNRNIVLLVFGEIDCRIHIYNASIKQNIPLEVAVQNTISAYSIFLKELIGY